MLYRIYEIAGEYAIAADSGQKVYDLIHPALIAETPIELDFAGVKIFASPFFNNAVGQLLKDISVENLNCLLSFTNLNTNGQTVLRQVITSAKRYYTDPQYQRAVDTVLEEYASSF
ncbi:MAG: STAS-like domain-containing protein [Oculatellaceae cyanobacterium bins.114]|nr:STAS-like domain-containing protein [Oculatellaceae cyanobacterium bins.114]